MKIYILSLLALAYLLRDYSMSFIWIACFGVFVPIRYAKDFLDRNCR